MLQKLRNAEEDELTNTYNEDNSKGRLNEKKKKIKLCDEWE